MADQTKRQRAQWKLRQAIGTANGAPYWARSWVEILKAHKLTEHAVRMQKCREEIKEIMDEAELILRERMKHLKEIKND